MVRNGFIKRIVDLIGSNTWEWAEENNERICQYHMYYLSIQFWYDHLGFELIDICMKTIRRLQLLQDKQEKMAGVVEPASFASQCLEDT